MSVTLAYRYQAALEVKAAADASGKLMCWKGHSMGCYLLLNVVDRLRWKGEDMQALFREVILDAPDVPTWFFSSMVKVVLERSSHVLLIAWPVGRGALQSVWKFSVRPLPWETSLCTCTT